MSPQVRITPFMKIVAAVLVWLGVAGPYCASAGVLKIYHIDVEQGAATLLVAPAGKTLLVDAGRNGHGARVKAVMQQAGVSKIDYFVLTHYHDDHYGGIDELAKDSSISIVKAYDRGEKDQLDAQTLNEHAYQNYINTIGQNAEQLGRGKTISLDPAMVVTSVACGGVVIGETNPVPGTDENDKSVALYIEYENFRFFIGGDIQITTEGKIAARHLVLDVDLYEADHHGSETSSTHPFVDDLKPSAVIISNGNRADYQHPRQHTLDLLAALSPKPKVFQTNKYFKGGAGGNVADPFIADLESTNPDGTILTRVDSDTGHFTVSFRDESYDFTIKPRGTTSTTGAIVIESLLPDPADSVGPDTTFEAVTLKNKGSTTVSLTGWLLRDKSNLTWTLTGSINAGESMTIQRNGMPMSLNNNGDVITLVGPGNQPQDTFTYTSSQPGVVIPTGR